MIIFENPGEIDIRAVTTFGVNAKVNDNPIGFFGTGLKYAIAILLRHGCEFTLYSGLTKYEFKIHEIKMRDKDFDLITMRKDGKSPVELGFTTDLGINWKLWMAYRELACNCKDEGGRVFQGTHAIPAMGKTCITVDKSEEFTQVYLERGKYILEDQPDMLLGTIEVRKRRSNDWYYRGIAVAPLQRASIYNYNDLQKCGLTEDRTLAQYFLLNTRLALAVMGATDKEFLKVVLTAKQDTLEGNLDYANLYCPDVSEEFFEVVKECSVARLADVNHSALKLMQSREREKVLPKEIQLSRLQENSLKRALDFCEFMGFPIRESYPIKVVDNLGEGVLGMAYMDTILIVERCFHIGGAKQVASTLIEEYIHLKYDFRDCTRELQTFLFDKLVSTGEELRGEAL